MTSDVYKHAPAGINERRLNRLNLRSTDPGSPGGAGVGQLYISAGDIAASISLSPPELYETTRYLSREEALQMLDRLLWSKYADDKGAASELWAFVMALSLEVMMRLKPDQKALARELREDRGVWSTTARIVIHDVCNPALYANLSDREWARMVKLGENYKAWQSRWRPRYSILRSVLQELDNAINDQVRRRI